jgi:hypothetical protein
LRNRWTKYATYAFCDEKVWIQLGRGNGCHLDGVGGYGGNNARYEYGKVESQGDCVQVEPAPACFGKHRILK